MKIAVVYQYYQGLGEPGHSLIYDYTQYLAARGHDVSVVAGEVGYMKRGVCSPLSWTKRLMRKEKMGGVNVIRTYTYSELHRSYLGRLLSFLSFSVTCPFGLLSLGKPDVVLVSSPPLFPAFSAFLICKLRRIPVVFEVRDLWPASAVQMGLLRNRFLIAVMSWMERLLYNGARKIIGLTQGICDDIHARGWAKDKIAMVPCGVDASLFYPDPEAGKAVRQKHGWDGKKIVLYFGALGAANNIPVTLRAAERLRERTDILFVLVGDGMKRGEIEAEIAAKNLSNVALLSPVPKQEARGYINAADLCLVTLQDIPLFKGAIPTKLIDYLACSKPVLSGVGGEAASILQASGAGVTFPPDDDKALAENVQSLLADEKALAARAAGAASFVQKNFSDETLHAHIETLLTEAATPK